MKTTTSHTTYTTYTIPGTDTKVELPFKPSSIMDFKDPLVTIIDDKIVLGYLADDSDCESPLENDDYMGQIYDCRRHSSSLRDYEKALGLDDGGPDLGLVDEDDVVTEGLRVILADPLEEAAALVRCEDQYDREPGESAEDFLRRILDTPGELECVLDDVDSIRLVLWSKGRAAGTIGNPYAVLLDIYEHGQVRYNVRGAGPQCRFDTARGGAVWVPNENLLDDIKRAADPCARAVILAAQAAETYTDWCNGNCFGTVVAVFDEDGNALESGETWGQIGDEAAYADLKIDFTAKCEEIRDEVCDAAETEALLGPATPKVLGMLPTMVEVPCISVHHLSDATQRQLNSHADLPMIYGAHENGYFIIHPASWREDDFPQDLQDVFAYFDLHVPPFGWSMLDVDGDVMPGLPVYKEA